ncbi:McrB family protein [Arcobacter vandammei]|uniref:McrB family protein n=1 Tax=Arcobacter vandammei TaxID=2782243 RepID=UPI0018DF646F|nr:AAA family ATPase [Arcobacter vandammei]
MRLKRNCIFFNAKIEGSATVDWGHELGQSSANGYLMKIEGCSEIINGLVFNQVKDINNFLYGRGNTENKDIEVVSIFYNVVIRIYDVEEDTHTEHTISKPLILIIAKETSGSHFGRRTLKMNIGFTYNEIKNQEFYNEIVNIIPNPCFAYSLDYDNVNTGILTLTIIKAPQPEPIKNKPNLVYESLDERNKIWDALEHNYSEKYASLNKLSVLKSSYSTTNKKASNIIYFGSPGTGKSFVADGKTGANIEGQKEFVEKTTFHPEYDYNSFVGGYKPVMVKKDEENKIEYKFVPQIFTNIYVKAWNNLNNHYFLQIEEINRGNCAEIFGDLFQLLDRDENGKSKYETTATEDLKIYLEENLKENGLDGIKGGKLRLPSNLSIIATMNTSDQSLFPMDSAFKRRWDWEYVPIEYDSEKSDSDFIIRLTSGSKYKWLDFLKEVNKRILDATHSQDKQVGNWFVNAKNTDNIIDEKTFINKVIFYLWNDVFKDEDETIFIKGEELLTYEHFFTNNINSELIEYIFVNNLNLIKIENEVSSEPKEA